MEQASDDGPRARWHRAGVARRSPITRSQTVAAALRYFRFTGGSTEEILARYALPKGADSDPQVTLTLSAMHALQEELATAARDPLFGLHLAEDMGKRSYDFYPLLEYLGRSAPTVRHNLDATIRFGPLGNEVMVLRLSEHDEAAIYEMLIPGEPACLGRHLNECLLRLCLDRMSRHVGPPFEVESVWLAHDAHEAKDAVERAFGAPHLEFGRSTNGFSFARELLDLPIPTADPRLFALLTAHGELLLAQRTAKSRFLGQVRQTIADHFDERLPTIESTAANMMMSPRSLQRRLGEEDTTFFAMLDSVREELARSMLQDPRQQVSDVADALHYSDTSAFVRAFRRWTGTTPGVFQRNRVPAATTYSRASRERTCS
jgi:AraC-like DNA-binding protein